MKSNVVFPRKPVVRLQKSIPVKTQNVAAANPKAFMGGGWGWRNGHGSSGQRWWHGGGRDGKFVAVVNSWGGVGGVVGT